MLDIDTQKILNNILSNLWKSDKEKIEEDWESLREYNSCK